MRKSLLSEAIAVVAMGCRLPEADSPQAFWQIIANGNSTISEVPETWLNREIYFDPQPGKTGKVYSTLGSIFDTQKIENEIANYHFHEQFRSCDPLLKLACIVSDEVVGQVVFPSGYDNYGIYLGGLRASDLSMDYILSRTIETAFELLRGLPEFTKLPAQIQHEIVLRSIDEARRKYRNENYWNCESPEFRLSDFVLDLRKMYGWTGAAYSVDAACASSLVAIDCAMTDILAGKIQGALVGGISAMTMLTPILFSKNFAATATLSRPFDAEADGMVGSMGVVFMFLKSLSNAERDGDEILGLIRGVGISSDGRGKSLWAPRQEGELMAMKRAYRETSITPQQLNYLEAHATSTSIGDCTELKSIVNLLNCSQDDLLIDFQQQQQQQNLTDDNLNSDLTYNNSSTELTESDVAAINVTNNRGNRKLAVGSVKANIGHAFEAAGFVGLMKVIQICRNKIIPPQINFSAFHSDFRDRQLPFFVPRELTRLEFGDDALMFGVDAFGVGGLNAHLIFEEYKKDKTPTAEQVQQPANQNTSAMTRSPIAVLGIGCVYPHAFSVDQ
ncbi:MAG: polyketide synthase, partial [Planctomycetaceae bacterium]|nr:polyketide synthase [Planctomycetaceae bacterium]